MRRRGHGIRRSFGIGCLVLIILAVVAMLGWFFYSANCVRLADEKPPSAADAPYLVTTDTRVYCVADYQESEAELVLLDYWDLQYDKWVHQHYPLRLKKEVYEKLNISER